MTGQGAGTVVAAIEKMTPGTARPSGPQRSSSPSALAVHGRGCGVLTAAHVMTRRPPIADQHTSLWSAWGRLRGPDNRHLVVVDHRLHPIGVLYDRELALAWPPGPLDAQRTPLRRLLHGRPRPQAHGGDDLTTVARTMLLAHTDAVPVVDREGRLLGLITARHCVELLARRLVT
jgi:CBS domain-containing protein